MEAEQRERLACPACGGAGGGPFGRAGSAWDNEEYVCARCAGVGYVEHDDVMRVAAAGTPRAPGLVKAVPDPAPAKPETGKRKASA